MGNEFRIEPDLETPFPDFPREWTDPVTGLKVPKTEHANLQWRADMLEAAEEDSELQSDMVTAASHSVLFFVNAFCFTLRVFESESEGNKQAGNQHLPFITWPIQDRHILKVEHAIDEGEELLTDKSRDMGATWDHIAVYAHRFLFRDYESHLLMSRKEDAVDQLDGRPTNYPYATLSSPGTLFGKIDYLLSRLPEWMLPSMSRKKLHLVNLSNNARIDGESSNATAGSSDRRTSIFLDEMAKMAEGESIKRSTRDVTACRLPCSTPNGAGTAYSQWRMSGTIPTFIMPWWEHPEKGQGRYVSNDELGRYKIRSPWYDREAELRSPKELAIEVDMDHVGSGDTFFEGTILEEHKMLFAEKPKRWMIIRFNENVPDSRIPDLLIQRDAAKVDVRPNKHGSWRVWCNLIRGRPDQTKTYTIGVDISKGQGASNSVISVMCNETREKIMEFADANTPPYELARIACAACNWVGGKSRPLLVWENNGDPGFDFGRQVVHTFNYPHIYFDRQPGTVAEKRGKRYGWRSTPEKKAQVLGELRRAYAHSGFINHSEEALDEAASYINFDNGGIGPAELVEETESARKTHGDRVIADAMCLLGVQEAPKNRPSGPKAPHRSIGGRMREWKRAKKQQQRKDRFDFRANTV
jgi:hypothetical protein